MKEEEKLFGILNFLPLYAQDYVQWLLTGLVILGIVNRILKKLTTPEMKQAWAAAKALGGTVANFAKDFAKSLDLPVKYPCGELFAHSLLTLNNYLAALYFFAFFVLVAVLTVVVDGVSPWQRLVGATLSAVAIIFARFCFAEAERGRVAFPVLYAKCQGKTSP
ncbi:MAG: hypothetical protein FD173_1069 [Gallionellaceae bacterium]|nr:MAG: hypothetical protein FD173_1069 [Gallionellaceae bacterium]